jgi:hypothetical protein
MQWATYAIDGPTSLLTGNVKYFEVAYGDPNKPLAESLKALAETYAKEHSIFREKDYR